MMLLNFLDEGIKEPYTDLVCSVIIVTVAREVTFDIIIYTDAVLVTDGLNLCILDSGE